ncbi:signal recognition particle subunit srp68 [Blyttiomyces sp. JEL0837]|nr:signal recognition particle subunit srp68 [Blyttiomyces sp. JEL0837]
MEVDKQADAPLKLDVLAMINEARNQYGLRHQDYQRYRHYCAKKIRRVRGVVGMTQRAKKQKYTKKPITGDSVTSNRALEVLLFHAERSWSYAMELKRESTDEPRKRHHSVKRLRRAAEAAGELEQVCLSKETDPRTALDVQAYASLMSGYFHFERQEWQEALDKFAASRTIYEKMASASITAEQEALCQAAIDSVDPNIRYCAYNLKMKGVGSGGSQDVAALLEMRRAAGAGAAGLDLLTARVEEVLAQSRKEVQSQTFTWRGKEGTTRNSKLIEALQKANEALLELEGEMEVDGALEDEAGTVRLDVYEKRLESFGKVVGAYWDATRIAEADVKEDEATTAKVTTSKSEEITANLKFILSYISFMRLSKTIERNSLLLQATKSKLEAQSRRPTDKKSGKFDDIVKAFDVILQTLGEMLELSAVKEDAALQAIITAKVSLYKGERVLHLAQQLRHASKLTQSLALYDRASEHSTESRLIVNRLSSKPAKGAPKKKMAETTIREEDQAELVTLDQQIKDLDARVRAGKLQTHAMMVIVAEEKGRGVAGLSKGVESIKLEEQETPLPLAKRLDEFVVSFNLGNPRLIDFPPRPQPIATKPILFDIAYNGIDYPTANLQRRMAGEARQPRALGPTESASVEEEETPKSVTGTGSTSGITGFLSGIWGRK